MKCIFYDGIKKQKLEVHFNVLALTFSKVILNSVRVCVKTTSKMQNNSREVKGHTGDLVHSLVKYIFVQVVQHIKHFDEVLFAFYTTEYYNIFGTKTNSVLTSNK